MSRLAANLLAVIAITAQSGCALTPSPTIAPSARAGDACITAFHPCGPDAVIVVIQRGDTLQDVALVPTTEGWVRLDLVRS